MKPEDLRDPDPDKTMFERLEENEDLLKAMLSMPVRVNEQMVESRREELFSFLWENTSMTQREVLESVKEAEQIVINEWDEFDIPEWLMRIEAQDMKLQQMHDRFQEEGLIE